MNISNFTRIIFAITAILLAGLSTHSLAQVGIESYYIEGDLTGKQSFTGTIGLKMNTGSDNEVSNEGLVSESNFIGILRYKYWFDKEWSVNASTGIFSAKSDLSFAEVNSISIIPFLFGFSHYPEALSIGKVGRSYIGLNTGIYFGVGSRANVSFRNVESSTVQETVFGIEPNAGIDFFLSDRIIIGPSFSYHIIADFKEVVGNRRNYSDPVFALNIGILF